MTDKHLELYKKYRPRTWDAMIGQDRIVQDLKNMAITKKVPTGLLFGGNPGSGKTTAAFILAKALNCDYTDENGDPCNECNTCKSIDNGSQPGINYIAMANNGSADDVRKITNNARLSQPVKQQVWILDEVQNLSPQAFDSLLVPLESENMKALFILCTTEPEKVRQAVMSRLQIRNFLPVSDKILAKHLAKISANEGWFKKDDENNKITPENIKDILQISDGSVRNAISNLEAFIATGIIHTGSAQLVLETILNEDIQEFYKLSNAIQENGESYIKILETIYKLFLEAMISKTSKKQLSLLEKRITDKMSPNIIFWTLDTIGTGLMSMNNKVIDYKILFETILLKIHLKTHK